MQFFDDFSSERRKEFNYCVDYFLTGILAVFKTSSNYKLLRGAGSKPGYTVVDSGIGLSYPTPESTIFP
jgi:hypothetical protein